MKRKTNLINLIGLAFAVLIAMQTDAAAQLISEIEIDPPSATNDACQYTEIRGAAGSVVQANTYFLSVNSDAGNFGFANQAVNIGGLTVGANGTITLFNTSFGECPNRTYGTGTTRFNYFNPLRVGTGSETYLIVRSTATLASGQDLDTNDDGVFDAGLGITVLDGFALLVNPEEEYVYGASAGVVNISNTTSLDQPDAVTRFRANNTPFAASAFFFGELAASPDETTVYVAPFSPNFPAGAVLTPGDANVGGPLAGGDARADFDGDGRTDLSVFRSGIWLLNRTTAGLISVPFGQAGDTIVPGDYDNDGRTDVAVRRGQVWYILNSGNSAFSGIQFGVESDIPVQGDYDGDGDTDVAVFRASNGTWYTSTNAAINYGAVQFGQSGDVPVQGDYDGDGRTDLAVFRNGTWFLNQSTAGQRAVPFGVSTDRPVQADYDGDNRDDIAVFRPSTGTWFILNSSNSTITVVQFGAATDVPVPGDYDGDNRDDIAVFRSGTWFINRTTSGAIAVSFGAASDEPVPNGYIP